MLWFCWQINDDDDDDKHIFIESNVYLAYCFCLFGAVITTCVIGYAEVLRENERFIDDTLATVTQRVRTSAGVLFNDTSPSHC